MNNRPTPETKWYVTEYPNECDFAVTDGNEMLAMIIGGNTIGDQCDLASRIAKLPDLERELAEAIDKYQSLQKTFEEWQLKFLSEQAKLLHNKDVERDKLFDEAYQIRIERDEAMKLSLKFRDALVSIEEYWNRDQNETAMADACWHAVNMAHDALAEAKEVLL